MMSQTQRLSGGRVSDGGTASATVAGKVMFKELANLCETISKVSQKEKKRKTLESFLKFWRDTYATIYPGNPQPPPETFFPFMRLLLADADKDRPVYGIKEHTLAKLYIEELGLAPTGEAAQMLLHWKKNKPRVANSADVSDFAGVAYYVLQNRLRKEAEISVKEVNEYLDAIAESNMVGGEERKEQTKAALHTLLRRTDPVEQKWLIRMILKDLKFGLGEESILAAFHPDAKDLYDVTSSISTVCTKLHDPTIRLSEIEVSLFAPVRPMLAETWSPEKLRTVLKGPTEMMYAEIKYDGDRCQIHKRGNQYKYFSRGGNDNSEILGKSPSEGTLTRYIADCFNPNVESFIIDGEICAYSLEAKCIATKAESYAIKGLTGESGYQVCFVAFDVLLYNGKTVTALPLRQRIPILKELFQEEEGRLYHAVRKDVTTPDQCYEFLNEAIDRNEEGIILKSPNSVYKPNARSAGWWKVKPEFVDSLSDHMDLLIVGAYYGSGRRSGVSHFMLAVAQAPENPTERPKKFLSFCRVGSGYTFKELHEMGAKLSPHLKPWTKTSKPEFLQLAPGDKEKPDLWVEPCNSFIVKVSAAQLLDSVSYATNCTLRFPRVKEPRYDKPWYECMTLTELLALKQDTSGRLGARNVTDEHLQGVTKKRARPNKAAVVRLAEHFRPADVGEVHAEGGFLAGKEFYVAGGDEVNSKQDLEKLIAENGGTFVQHPHPSTFCIISQKMTVHVSNIVKQLPLDVVLPAWLIRCFDSKRVIPWNPKDLIFTKKATLVVFNSVFDQYGDSNTEPITGDDVERLFREMEGKVGILERGDLAEFELEYFTGFPLNGLFRLTCAYIDKYEKVGNVDSRELCPGMLALAEEYIHAFCGQVKSKIDNTVTHVIVHPSGDMQRLEEFNKLNRKRKVKFHIVTANWAVESVKECTLVDERGHVPRKKAVSQSGTVVGMFDGLFD